MIEILNSNNPGFYEACKVLNLKDKKVYLKDPRDYIKCLHVVGEHCYGTDSKSLVRCITPVELDDGFYTVVKLTKKMVYLGKVDDSDYPDVSRLFDQEGAFELPIPNNSSIGEIQYHLAKKADIAVNPDYLAPVKRNIEDLKTVITKPGDNHPVLFDFIGEWVLVVMPINVR